MDSLNINSTKLRSTQEENYWRRTGREGTRALFWLHSKCLWLMQCVVAAF